MSIVHEQNRRAWDATARRGRRFTQAATERELAAPLKFLDACGWLGPSVRGLRVLCLGAGGGRQSALFAAAGAIVSVVDISGEMLALDEQVARRHGLEVRTIKSSMDDLSRLEADEFDLVWQPVSTCYVPRVVRVYREVARVLCAGGVYVSQHKQPASLQADVAPSGGGYLLREPYYRDDPLPPVSGSLHREHGTLEYLHRWEELVGGLCRAGFVIEDLVEPLHAEASAENGSFADRSRYLPPYVRIKARRVGASRPAQVPVKTVWVP